jgi:hypothetical protein
MGTEKSVWERLDDKLKYLAPVFLLLLVVYLYSSLVSPLLSKQTLQYVEVALIAYFVFELVVKYIISDNYRQFLHDYWFDIVLLVPFFKSLRLLGAAGKLFKSIKALKSLKYIRKAVKIPKLVKKTLSPERSDAETDSEKD